jgi:hypothetical protein
MTTEELNELQEENNKLKKKVKRLKKQVKQTQQENTATETNEVDFSKADLKALNNFFGSEEDNEEEYLDTFLDSLDYGPKEGEDTTELDELVDLERKYKKLKKKNKKLKKDNKQLREQLTNTAKDCDDNSYEEDDIIKDLYADDFSDFFDDDDEKDRIMFENDKLKKKNKKLKKKNKKLKKKLDSRFFEEIY